MSESIGIGNELNRIIQATMSAIFTQGELAQLSHSSFDLTATGIQNGLEDEIKFEYPIGYQPTREPLVGTLTYKRDELVSRYAYLAHTQIPMNGIYQLSMLIESMLSDLIRRLVLMYPAKLGSKRQISLKSVFESTSLSELHLAAAESVLLELSYKSPRDFASEAEDFLSVNLLECPSYHIYIEMKATRDVFIHNRGIANEIYVAKAGSHARAAAGFALPINQVYFLEVYEACLQFIEWIQLRMHEKWHSTEFDTRKNSASDA